MGTDRIQRLLKMIMLLQAGTSRTSDDMADELGVSRRTVFRDLRTLQSAGVPCGYNPETGFTIEKQFYLPPINLSISETLGLLLLGRTAESQRGRPLVGPALSAINKLVSTLPEEIRAECAQVSDSLSVNPGPMESLSGEGAYFGKLQFCVGQHRKCRIHYNSLADGGRINVVIHPYLMHYASRAWYVFAFSELHNDVRVFKINRILDAQMLDDTFTPKPRFKASDKLGKAWLLIPEKKIYTVVLHFDRMVARNVAEVRWHQTQQVTWLEDGSCKVQFEVDGIREISWWVCSYADQVAVVEPDELRAMVAERLLNAAQRHASPPGELPPPVSAASLSAKGDAVAGAEVGGDANPNATATPPGMASPDGNAGSGAKAGGNGDGGDSGGNSDGAASAGVRGHVSTPEHSSSHTNTRTLDNNGPDAVTEPSR